MLQKKKVEAEVSKELKTGCRSEDAAYYQGRARGSAAECII